MRTNTKLGIIAIILLIGAIALFMYFMTHMNILILAAMSVVLFVSGMFTGGAVTEQGKVCEFKNLNDGAYTYLGKLSGVYILKHVNDSGGEDIFTVNYLETIKSGIEILPIEKSFKKMGEKIIPL